MDKQKLKVVYDKIVSICLCFLLVLCLCFPAQWQIIKLPFLAVVVIAGFYEIIQSRGKALDKRIWVWMGAYLVYNLVWGMLGIINNQPGANDYLRLGVLWPIVFLLIIPTITKKRAKWVDLVMLWILAFQTLAIIQMVGYGFQLWPNFLNVIFPVSAVGIHNGYVQVTGHFIGSMAFTAPYVYCEYVFNQRKNSWRSLPALVFWFIVVWALVATSRRMLLIVLVICVLVTVAIAFIRKETYKKYILRSTCGALLTVVFIGIATTSVANTATTFLNSNFDEIHRITYEHEPVENGKIKYWENVVLDLEGTHKYLEIHSPVSNEPDLVATEPSTTITEPSVIATEPFTQNGLQGYTNRITEMLEELTGDSVRGRIISGVLKGWAESPIFGVGFGAELPEYTSDGGNGIYEMEYIVRLYTTGVAGIAVLLSLLACIGIISLNIMRKSQNGFHMLASCTVAYLGALVATVSNPYIFSGFDYMWMLFLPIALLNSAVKEKNKTK